MQSQSKNKVKDKTKNVLGVLIQVFYGNVVQKNSHMNGNNLVLWVVRLGKGLTFAICLPQGIPKL